MRERKELVTVKKRRDRRGYQIEYYYDGRRIRTFAKLKSVADVEKRRISILLSRGMRPLAVAAGGGTAIIDKWLAEVKLRGLPNTVMDYRSRIKRFARWAGTRLYKLNQDDILRWREERLKKVQKGTVNGDLRVVKAHFNWCVKRGYLAYNPAKGISQFRVQQSLPAGILSREETRKLLSETQHTIFLAVFAVGIHAGLRASELSRLAWEDIDFEKNIIYVRGQTKTYRDRAVPMSATLRGILKPLAGEGPLIGRHTQSWMGQEGNVLLRGILGRGSIGHLRHTFASLHAQAGTSLYKIARWMGHSNTYVTERYAHLCQHDDDIDKI